MKTTIDEKGLMKIEPQTPLEAYALRQWMVANVVTVDDTARHEQLYWRGSGLMVSGDIPAEPPFPPIERTS